MPNLSVLMGSLTLLAMSWLLERYFFGRDRLALPVERILSPIDDSGIVCLYFLPLPSDDTSLLEEIMHLYHALMSLYGLLP